MHHAARREKQITSPTTRMLRFTISSTIILVLILSFSSAINALDCIKAPVGPRVDFNGAYVSYGDDGQPSDQGSWYEGVRFPSAAGGKLSIDMHVGTQSSITNVSLSGNMDPCLRGDVLCGTISGPFSSSMLDATMTYDVMLACVSGKARLTGAGKLTKFFVPVTHQALRVEWEFLDNRTAVVKGTESFIKIDGSVMQDIWTAWASY